MSRGRTVEVKCACGTMFTARVADRNRGWAKSCSKSCAARRSNTQTGKYREYLYRVNSGLDGSGRDRFGYYHEREFSNAHLFIEED